MASLLSRFRGCLVGALTGDCLGAHFEGSPPCIPRELVITHTRDTIKQEANGSVEYTDDSAMTRAICRSLIDHQGYDDKSMAYAFVDEFYRESDRGYGPAVSTIFSKLKKARQERKLEEFDVMLPAREQFDGQGSYGNGAAMRVSPLALFSKDSPSLQECAHRNALLTHAHLKGVNGAILQAEAVFMALHLEPQNLNKEKFVDQLAGVAQNLEEKEPQTVGHETSNRGTDEQQTEEFSYAKKIREMKDLLAQKEDLTIETVFETFGNGILAEEAVPAAIFAFLHKGDESFEECINYAINLGGDTDTIASMTGAICGAYWGLESIPELWREKCEGVVEGIEFADKLFALREKEQ